MRLIDSVLYVQNINWISSKSSCKRSCSPNLSVQTVHPSLALSLWCSLRHTLHLPLPALLGSGESDHWETSLWWRQEREALWTFFTAADNTATCDVCRKVIWHFIIDFMNVFMLCYVDIVTVYSYLWYIIAFLVICNGDFFLKHLSVVRYGFPTGELMWIGLYFTNATSGELWPAGRQWSSKSKRWIQCSMLPVMNQLWQSEILKPKWNKTVLISLLHLAV